MLTGHKNFYKHSHQWICSKFSLKMPQHLKCLATMIYDLPLITIPVSNCHLFSDINISQGSVATRLRCGGIFNYHFTANLSLSLTMKEFWKSVKIWQSYRHEFGGPVFFWNTVYCSEYFTIICVLSTEHILPATLVVQVQQSVGCVCANNNFRRKRPLTEIFWIAGSTSPYLGQVSK